MCAVGDGRIVRIGDALAGRRDGVPQRRAQGGSQQGAAARILARWAEDGLLSQARRTRRSVLDACALKEEFGKVEFVASMADAAVSTWVIAKERVYIMVWGRHRCGGPRMGAHCKGALDEEVRHARSATYFLGMELTLVRLACNVKVTEKKLKRS